MNKKLKAKVAELFEAMIAKKKVTLKYEANRNVKYLIQRIDLDGKVDLYSEAYKEVIHVDQYASDIIVVGKPKEQEEPPIGILDVSPEELPQSLVTKIEEKELYTFMDTHDLQEHLYGIDGIKESCQEHGIYISSEETKALDTLSKKMAKKDCAYFRIVKF